MELIYSLKRRPVKCEPPQVSSPYPETARPLCTISVLNVIAFSSGCELHDTDGDSWGGHVYVCDLDTPWDAHKVASVDCMVSCLEWDCEGRELVVGTVAGTVSVFGQKDHLLNKWQLLYTTTFKREPIVGAIMFHNGRRVSTVDSADANIAERLHALRPAATLKGLGGVSVPGCLVITSTSIIAALTAGQGEGGKAHLSTGTLRHKRDLVCRASMVHKKDGSILIAAICRDRIGGGAVRASCCTMRLTAHRPMLKATILPAVKLQHMPTCVAWSKDDTDSVYIGGASLSLWRLENKPVTVHKLLIKAGNPNGAPKSDSYNTLCWQRVATWPLDQPAYSVSANGLPKPGALAVAGGTLVKVAPSNQPVCSLSIISSEPPPPPPPPPHPSNAKRYKYAHKLGLSGCSMSPLCGVAVCVDTRSQIHVCNAHTYDTTNQASLMQAVHALEWCAVSGHDALDVLLTVAPHAEVLHDRLSELFSRQSPHLQQYYYHSFQRIKISLLRLVPRAYRTVSSLSLLQSLHLAWAAVSAALRPDDKPDSALVAALLDDKMVTHHDKALLALEAKQEPIIEWTALAALRCQLKRAADIAVTAVAAVPHPQHPYELYNDPSAILLLRKLLVVARPDPALTRILSRLPPHQHQHSKELVEECAALVTVHTARVWECHSRVTVSSTHGVTRPHQLEYFVEPAKLRIVPEPPAYLRDDGYSDMDSVTYMYLGVSCSSWRACSRCAAPAAPAATPAQTPRRMRVQRALTNRMTTHCKCGGKWKLMSNVRT